MKKNLFILIFALLLNPSFAFADSDGSFCLGKGYLAFESGLFESKHVLTILRPADGDKIVDKTTTALKDDMVHSISCKDNQIDVYYWNELCSMQFGSPDFKCTPNDNKGFPSSMNFRELAFTDNDKPLQQKILPLTNWGKNYELHMLGYEYNFEGSIQHFSITRIVKYGESQSRILGTYNVYDGYYFEPIDDESLPKDVSAFITKRDTCDHFRGEPYEGGDHTEIGRERYKYVTGKLEEYCTGTDKTLADLRQKYSENPSVIEKLSMYDDKIE